MSNKKICGTCTNAKFRSDSCTFNDKDTTYLICQLTNKVVDCKNTCEKHKCFPDGQPTWLELIDIMRC